MSLILSYLKDLFKRVMAASQPLFRIMIPVLIAVKILKEFGAIEILGKLLAPVMHWVGLPGSMGLVWAAGMLTNLYGAILVYMSIGSETMLTTAQMTVLATMLLLAHALPLELRIVQKAGPRMRWMILARVGGALLLGLILHLIFSRLALLQHPNVMAWQPKPVQSGWAAWVLSEIKNLVTIFFVIAGLLVLMDVLKVTGLFRLLDKIVSPGLRILGIGAASSHLTLIGLTLGLGYGGGLLIAEAKAGHIQPKDVFLSLLFMSLCHSLIEDTLVMAALGGHFSGILIARIVFAFAVTIGFSMIIKTVSQDRFYAHWYRCSQNKKSGSP